MPVKCVSYCRVSTARQGETGYGLAVQLAEVEAFARAKDAVLIASFTEVASGRTSDRPELQRAIDLCRAEGATLVVARVDRLSRSMKFISEFMESDVPFIACENPTCNPQITKFLAAVAEQEREALSSRIKSSLAVAKSRGVKLGSAREGHWTGREHLRGRGKPATPLADGFADLITRLRSEGESFEAISTVVNERGFRTPTGKLWSKSLIHRVVNHRL